MIAYGESSAVLAWILGEAEGEGAREYLAGAERVVSSTLTAIECHRSIARGARDGTLGPTDELAALRLLESVAVSWVTLEMTGAVLDRARRGFPREPVGIPAAIHLATAAQFHEAMSALVVVSLDEDIRANAEALAMAVGP